MNTSIRNRTVPLPFQHIRLLILLVFGLAYVWVLPPFEAPDEPAHFARAYSLAEGQAVLKDHPRKLVVFLRDAMKERLAARHMEVQEVPVLAEMERCLREKKERIPNIAYNSAQYSPVPYLFHAAVIRLVMLFDPTSRGLMVSLYACRIVSLLVFVGLLWVAFLLFPALSWPLFWLSITPMALSQASVVSVDYIVFLSAAILLTAALGDVRGTASAVCLICSAFFLLLTRPPYLWLLLVPVTSVFLSRDKNKGSMAWLVTVAVVVSLGGAILWNGFAQWAGIYKTTIAAIQQYLDPGINPSAQWAAIFNDPLQVFEVMFLTFSIHGGLYFHQFVGVLGWLDLPMPIGVVVAWGALVVLALVISDVPSRRDWGHSAVMGIVCLIAAVLSTVSVFLSMYMIWVPVGSATGYLQGRYLHPVALAAFAALVLMKPFDVGLTLKKWGGAVLLAVAAGVNAASIATVVERFGWF